jgi:hypothetical protein
MVYGQENRDLEPGIGWGKHTLSTDAPPAISQTSNDVMEIYYIVYDVVYDVVYDIVYDVTRFVQPAARLLHQPTLLPSDGTSKLQLLSALILECVPAASLLHP